MKEQRTQGKFLNIEILRILAVLAVIFNHTVGYMSFYNEPLGSAKYWLYQVISIGCKVAVPLFMAISGALLLVKEESCADLFRKRVLRIILAIIIFNLLYVCVDIINGSELTIREAMIFMYTEGLLKYHLWYLPMYMGFLLTLPFLRAMVKNLENKYFIYLIVLAVIFKGIIPSLEFLIWNGKYTLNENINFSWLLNYVILYPCIGYYLQHRIDIKRCKASLKYLWPVSIFTVIITAYVNYKRQLVTGELLFQDYMMLFTVILCVTIYVSVRVLFENKNISENLVNIICVVGKCTFGIYLCHILVLEHKWINGLSMQIDKLVGNVMVVSIFQTLMVFLVSFVLTLAVKSLIELLHKMIKR